MGEAIVVREIVDADARAPSVAGGLVRVERSFWSAVAPDEPLVGADELRLELFQAKARKPHRVWVATDGDGSDVVGYARIELPQEENREQIEAWVLVAPEARRRGAGSALLRAAIDAEPERTVIASWVRREDGAAFCEALGLTERQEERGSRLDTTIVDDAQQRAWIEDSPARAKGYRMISWRGAYPAAYEDEICEAADSMRDAPRDDVEFEHGKVTPAMLRDGEASVAGRLDQFGSLCLGPAGEPAGFTELGVNLHRPELGEQGDTCVVAAHRGLHIGRWLKAANLAQARAAWPKLRFVHTYNAETNPWMLAINVDQGYRPHSSWFCYQGAATTAREALGD